MANPSFIGPGTVTTAALLELVKAGKFIPYTWQEATSHAAGTTDDVDFPGVPEGYILILTDVSAIDEDNSPTTVRFKMVKNGSETTFRSASSPTAGASTDFAGMVFLQPGDFVRVTFTGATANDDLLATLNGYLVRV